MDRGALLSLPNLVSMSRLALAAAFVVLPATAARLALIVAASATDVLDGWLARRANAATRWGALIDPIADRVFVFTVVCTYLFEGRLGTGQYFVLLARDIMTAVGFVVARSISWLRPVEFRARPLGKAVTALQLVVLLAVLLVPEWVAPLVQVVGLLAAASVIDYTLALWRARAA